MRARTSGGAGERVLWVHGYTIDSSLWEELWARLPGWQHVGVDLPGHGLSSPLAPSDTLISLANVLGEWSIRNDVRHIVGLSLGSTVALQVVLSFPDAFASLTLGAPAIGGGPVERDVGVLYVELLQMLQARGSGPWITDRWMTSPPELFTHARRRSQLWRRLEEVIGRHGWEELPGFQMARLATCPQRLEDVAAIAAPLLVLVGEHELPAFVETARLLQATSSACRTIVLPACGHLCMLEAPVEAAPAIEAHWSGAMRGPMCPRAIAGERRRT